MSHTMQPHTAEDALVFLTALAVSTALLTALLAPTLGEVLR